MMSLLFVSITKFVFISACAYCLPYLVHSRYSRKKPPWEPQSQPKFGKTRFLKCPDTAVDHSNWKIMGVGGGKGEEWLFAGIPL